MNNYKSCLFFLLSLFLSGCDKGITELLETQQKQLEAILSGEAHADAETIAPDLSGISINQGLRVVKAEIDGQEYEFFTRERVRNIASFPCSECHGEKVFEVPSPHSQINLAHFKIAGKSRSGKASKSVPASLLDTAGQEQLGDCAVCHGAKDKSLTTLKGEKINFDRSYQLCAQCHFEQVNDWKGGAHGKRVGGWVPPRIVTNCVECHNPHAPAFPKRWPAVLLKHWDPKSNFTKANAVHQ